MCAVRCPSEKPLLGLAYSLSAVLISIWGGASLLVATSREGFEGQLVEADFKVRL